VIEPSEAPRDAPADSRWPLILARTDGSAGATHAVGAAVGLAAALNTDLWIANVIDGTSESALRQYARAEEASIGGVAEAAAHSERGGETCGSRRGEKDPHGAVSWKLRQATRRRGARDRRQGVFVGCRRASGPQDLTGSVSQKLAGIALTMLVIVP
jgi:hypothetical protein